VIGFALNGADRVRSACDLYDFSGLGRPYIWSLYAYDNPGLALRDTDLKLKEKGEDSTGLLISEAYVNDLNTALELNATQAEPGFVRAVYFLTQWHFLANKDQVIPPSPFNNYRDNGW